MENEDCGREYHFKDKGNVLIERNQSQGDDLYPLITPPRSTEFLIVYNSLVPHVMVAGNENENLSQAEIYNMLQLKC